MNMLAFDPIRAMSHDFQYFAIPPKLYKRGKAVVRLGRRGETGEEQHQNKQLHKL